MKILFHNPPLGSGHEQIGYVFVLLLKKLGHSIDFWNTSNACLQEDVISKTIDDYDFVVLNLGDQDKKAFDRILKVEKKHIYVIQHTLEHIAHFVKTISLNYPNHAKFAFGTQNIGIVFPVTYPYFYNQKIKAYKQKKYRFVYLGRWNDHKFDQKVWKFMLENKIYLDMAYINCLENNNYNKIVKKVKFNQSADKVFGLLANSEYLLLPSKSECIGLVIGEALVAGCIPIIHEAKDRPQEQFYNAIKCHSMNEFNQKILELKDKRVDPKYRQKVMDFSQRMWSIDKTIEELRMIFGSTGKKGKINVMYNDHNDMTNILPYKNACIITGETL
ncbi:MAG: hypothetical protein WC242_05325 [Candidatus Paceibacterota bacterium]